nr:MAG TPA: hypothetical protein [Caudoviricetes sp.]
MCDSRKTITHCYFFIIYILFFCIYVIYCRDI